VDYPLRPAALPIAAWLVGHARVHLAPAEIVTTFCERLLQLGVPVSRARVAQMMTNPLIGAWGVVWRRDRPIDVYTVPRTIRTTDAFLGSPFEQVMKTRQAFRRSLVALVPGEDHPVLLELAEDGGTDYLAVPIEYGDGSVQVAAFTTDRPGGWSEDDVEIIESLRTPLAAALEPSSMRRSMLSLLETYLGTGPARSVADGAIERGALTTIDAAVLLTDLRGFTNLSERHSPQVVLDQLGDYFEVVVDAVRASGGDVLKFIGDGVLSIFPAERDGEGAACIRAVEAVARAVKQASATSVHPFVTALHVGPVVYGNIGSPDRLDFTVLGPTVNVASRLEAIAKAAGPHVCSAAAAAVLPRSACEIIGEYELKGVAGPQKVFRVLPNARDAALEDG
jgi:adenylate cyclase